MNPIQFQGLYVFEGTEKNIKAAAKKHKKGTSYTASYFENGKGELIVIDKEHGDAFTKELGLKVPETKFQWLHPIRSIKTRFQAIQDFAQQFRQYVSTTGFAEYRQQVHTFVKEQEAAGEKVTRIQVD